MQHYQKRQHDVQLQKPETATIAEPSAIAPAASAQVTYQIRVPVLHKIRQGERSEFIVGDEVEFSNTRVELCQSG